MKIDRKHISDLTYEQFLTNYVDNAPLVIEGIMENWEISGMTLDKFNENFGSKKVPIRGSNVDDFEKYYQVKISDYIQNMNNNNEQFYCDFSPDLKGFNELKNSYIVPDYFNINTTSKNENDIILQWFYLGGKDTGTPLHTDYGGSNAWNALVFGEKEWIIFNKNSKIEKYEGSIDLLDKSFDSKDLLDSNDHIHLFQQPNEIVYIPSHFWHQVRNTEPSLCITGNFWFI